MDIFGHRRVKDHWKAGKMNIRTIQVLGLLVIVSTVLAACAAGGTTPTPLPTTAATGAPTLAEVRDSNASARVL